MQAHLPDLQTVRLAHGRVAYREAGSGPALLLLHGMAGASASWVRQLEALSSSFRVVAWDAPGFGGSDVVEPDLDAYAGAARRLLEALGIDASAVVGHSMGGLIAVRLAASSGALVSRLVLSCSHAGFGDPQDSPPRARYTRRLAELESMPRAEYGAARARKILPAQASPEVFGTVAAIAATARAEGLLAAGRMSQIADNRPLLGSLAMPVLVLTAELDRVLPAANSLPFLEKIANARHVTLAGVGHAPYLEDPDAYNAALRGFLQDA
jgi:pimeloyl-ACP methyl ester carboxylesterase